MKVVTLLHEGTLTGAPIAGIKTAMVFAKLSRSEIFVVGRRSNQFDDYCRQFEGEVNFVSGLNVSKNDLIVCHSGALCKAVTQLAQRGFRVLWWIHEDTHLFNLIDATSISTAFRSAWGVVTVSPHCAYRTFANFTWSRDARNLFIVPNTLPLGMESVSPYHIDNGVLTVIHIGTLGRLKGTDVVLECAKALMSESIKFKLIGRVLDPIIEEEARKINNVELVGEQSPFEVKQLLSKANVMVHPTRLDNQPLVVLEALASAVPVVASKLPSLTSFASNDDGLFSCNPCVSDYIGTILKVISEKPKAKLPIYFSEEYFESSLRTIFRIFETERLGDARQN